MNVSDEMARFSENVKALRLAHGWSQTDLAERVGISHLTVCRLELAQRMPSLWVAYAICKVLGVSVDDMCNKEYLKPNVTRRMVGKWRCNNG